MRSLLKAGLPPLLAAACLPVFFVALVLVGFCAYGECGPNRLAWIFPAIGVWAAGTALWVSGVRSQRRRRAVAGAVLLALVPVLAVSVVASA